VSRGAANGAGGTGAEVSDEGLMRALAAGEETALRELYARHAPAIFALAARSLERASAEEIVQDVFLALWQSAERFDAERGTLRSWLLVIAQRRIANELRRRSRRPTLADADSGEAHAALADPAPGPAAEAWLAYRRDAVREAVEHLPPEQRQALGPAFFDELTHAQVAEVLQLRLGTAKTRIRSGLRRLRAPLAGLVALLALAFAGGIGSWVVRERARAGLEERALALVTSSEVTPLRLEPAGKSTSETHATYRARAGTGLAVLTLAHFAPPPADRVYQGWIRHGTVYTSLGAALPDANGHALLVAEDAALAADPEELVVTVEPAAGSSAPTGPTVVSWPKRSDPVGDAPHEERLDR
jgi:RNA polymerase sigma factor (sigma-70 family)